MFAPYLLSVECVSRVNGSNWDIDWFSSTKMWSGGNCKKIFIRFNLLQMLSPVTHAGLRPTGTGSKTENCSCRSKKAACHSLTTEEGYSRVNRPQEEADAHKRRRQKDSSTEHQISLGFFQKRWYHKNLLKKKNHIIPSEDSNGRKVIIYN